MDFLYLTANRKSRKVEVSALSQPLLRIAFFAFATNDSGDPFAND